jgi:hypothetical protein
MTRILEALPPPDLSYPPEGYDLDRPILTAETSYLRTRLPDNTTGTPSDRQEPDDGLAGFVSVVKHFIPENDGACTCSMCGYV